MKDCSTMLVRIAQADAYAAACEYCKDEEHVKNVLKFEKYMKHPTHNLSAGRYTDDTQMSIGVANVMISRQYSKLAFADSWVTVFRRDPRPGYSKKFYDVLQECKTGQDLLDKVEPTSTKNGGAMRAMLLGLIKDPKEAAAVSKLQASVTHNSVWGLFAAQASTMLAHFSIHTDLPFSSFRNSVQFSLIENNNLFPKTPNFNQRIDGSDSLAIATISSVWTALCSCSSLMDILKMIIIWGGDTDTAAAIAWGIAAPRHTEEQLSSFFEFGLEPGRLYGYGFLMELNRHLLAAHYG